MNEYPKQAMAVGTNIAYKFYMSGENNSKLGFVFTHPFADKKLFNQRIAGIARSVMDELAAKTNINQDYKLYTSVVNDYKGLGIDSFLMYAFTEQDKHGPVINPMAAATIFFLNSSSSLGSPVHDVRDELHLKALIVGTMFDNLFLKKDFPDEDQKIKNAWEKNIIGAAAPREHLVSKIEYHSQKNKPEAKRFYGNLISLENDEYAGAATKITEMLKGRASKGIKSIIGQFENIDPQSFTRNY